MPFGPILSPYIFAGIDPGIYEVLVVTGIDPGISEVLTSGKEVQVTNISWKVPKISNVKCVIIMYEICYRESNRMVHTI